MSRFEFEFDLFYILIVIGVVLFISVLSVKDCQRQQACEARGGRVVETNCRTTIRCETINHDGTFSTECHPYTTCDWTCVQGPAERP